MFIFWLPDSNYDFTGSISYCIGETAYQYSFYLSLSSTVLHGIR